VSQAHPVTGEVAWVRTNRKDTVTGVRTPGPWHAEYRDYGMTWCGRFPGRLIASSRVVLPPQTVPNDGPLCLGCDKAMALGTPTPFRRTR
jgi:hypothetical protein